MDTLKNTVIIGDGFAAAAMAIHLLRGGMAPESLTMIGPRPPGRGQAYACVNPFFRLNIREDLPIVFSEDPMHFARWAKDNIHDPDAKTDAGYFYRRQDFGAYVAELFDRQPGSSHIKRIQDRVIALQRSGLHWTITLDSGGQYSAERVILATGNPPPTWPCVVVDEHSSSADDSMANPLIENPWPGDYLTTISPNDRVILLGGGLTALDAINALVEQGHRGQVYVISPRPYFPPAQSSWERHGEPDWPDGLTPARLIRFMRDYLPDAPTDSSTWQNSWEELRPKLNTIWQSFSAAQRRKLIKRVGWIWSLYRFRASPQTIAAYEKLRAANQIEFVVGRAKKIIRGPTTLAVEMSTGAQVSGDRLVNCTGVASDALLEQLIAAQLALPDALDQAIAVDTAFRVLGPDQQPWANLWMIGPATAGSLGDVVAASAISKQAEQLSARLLA